MSTAITTPVTIEQFVCLNLPEGREWELHNGQIVDMGQPTLEQRCLQRQIFLILERLFPTVDVLIEYPFQIEKTSVRSADVGVAVNKDRVSDDLLEGAPELVVEVLSPSHTVTALKEYRRLCFAHGTQVFFTVDPDDRTVQVHIKAERDGHTYGAEEQISIELFGLTVTLAIDDIFSDGGSAKRSEG